MINFVSMYLSQWFDQSSNLHEYGSELESYILARNPQSIHEVELLTQQFQQQQLSQGK